MPYLDSSNSSNSDQGAQPVDYRSWPGANLAPAPGDNNAPTGVVTISGNLTDGETLTANHTLADADGLGEISFNWYIGGNFIPTGPTNTIPLIQADVGLTVYVTAVYTDGNGNEESVSSAVTAAVSNTNDAPTGSVVINGIARQGETLMVSNTLQDRDGLGAISYQWNVDDVAVQGATSDSFALTQAHVGSFITVTASYTDGFGQQESVTSFSTASVTNAVGTPTGSVTISGTASQGQTLVVMQDLADADGLGEFNYQWHRAGVDIAGATSSSYLLTQSDVGSAISVTISYVDGGGTSESITSNATAVVANINDDPTGQVSISGTPSEDEVLTSSHTLNDLDGMGTITYQWYADGQPIPNATFSAVRLSDAEVGSAISVTLSYTDGFGTMESVTSESTSAVTGANTGSLRDVTIFGDLVEGSNLLASYIVSLPNGEQLDQNDLSFQWLRGGLAIQGATSAVYVLTQDDVGAAMAVQVTYNDGVSPAETVASVESAPVTNVNDTPTGTVTIDGSLVEGQALFAVNTLADEDGLGDITYQWYVGGVHVPTTPNNRILLVEDDVGKTVYVTASYTDAQGTQEMVSSAVSVPVADLNHTPVITVPTAITYMDTAADDVFVETNFSLQATDDDQGDTLSYGILGGTEEMGSSRLVGTYGSLVVVTATGSYTYFPDNDAIQMLTSDANEQFTLTVSDGTATAQTNLTVAVDAVNDLPFITSSDVATVPEGQSGTLTVTAEDRDSDTLSFSLSGGVDQAFFQIDANTGQLQFVNAPDFENPQDDGADNVYKVEVTASDPLGGSVSQVVSVEVTDVQELVLNVQISGQSAQGQTLSATSLGLTGESLSYQWYVDGEKLEGETGATLKLGYAEIGKKVHVEVEYGDVAGRMMLTSGVTAPITGDLPVIVDNDEFLWDSLIQLPGGEQVSVAEAQLFRTYFGSLLRLPDDGGFNWWLGEIEAGRHDLRSMAEGFLWSPEFLGYVNAPDGNSIANDVFLTHMYQGVFGRSPDGDGYNWWLNELQTGNRSQVDVLVDMTQSNEYVELTKLEAADYLFA